MFTNFKNNKDVSFNVVKANKLNVRNLEVNSTTTNNIISSTASHNIIYPLSSNFVTIDGGLTVNNSLYVDVIRSSGNITIESTGSGNVSIDSLTYQKVPFTLISSSSTISTEGTYFINSLSNPITITLNAPTDKNDSKMNIVELNLLHHDGNLVRINMPKGTYLLNSNTPYLKLYYNDYVGTWIDLSNKGELIVGNSILEINSPSVSANEFGSAIALSSDGNTMAIGAPRYSTPTTDIGGVYIYIRTTYNPVSWSYQAGPLQGSGSTGGAYMGATVSLSHDGNTLAIGGPENNSGEGAIWIFVRSGTSWSEQAGPLIGTDASGNPNIGYSLSLSGDGNTVAFSGPFQTTGLDTDRGAFWIYSRINTSWSEDVGPVGFVDASGDARIGESLSLSKDGNTLVVGARGFPIGTNVNCFAIFTKDNNSWKQMAPYTRISYEEKYGGALKWVALSSDGTSLAVACTIFSYLNTSNAVGGVWIYNISPGSIQYVSGPIRGQQSVAYNVTGNIHGAVGNMSPNGKSLLISRGSTPTDANSIFFMLSRNDTNSINWKHLITNGTDYLSGFSFSGSFLGYSDYDKKSAVAYSSNGDTLVIGGGTHNSNVGGVFIFN